MTAPTPNGDHLDLDAIAALDEGLTDGPTAAAQEQHLAECPTCTATRTTLRTTRALLSTLPAEPMPADVAQRIDTALAAGTGTIVPTTLPKRRLWARHPSLAGLVAAAAVAGLVAAVAIGAIHHNDNNGGTSASGGATLPNSLATPTRQFPITESGRNYTKKNALALAPALARESSVPGGLATAGAKPKPLPQSLQRLHSSKAALDACIAALNAGASIPQQPFLVDFAAFEGKPAVLVLMPGILAGHIDVWLVGPHCTAQDADLKFYKSTLTSG